MTLESRRRRPDFGGTKESTMTDMATPSYQTSADAALNFSESAARKVRELIAEEAKA